MTAAVTYTACETSLGTVRAAWTERGLACLGLEDEPEEAFLARVRARTGRDAVRDDGRLGELHSLVERWLAGQEVAVDLDLSGLTPFEREVLEYTRRIPRGQVETYGAIARALGRPRAARAVGAALGRNPLPLLIPCHRVVSSAGRLQGFAYGGPARKAQLLRMEGARLRLPGVAGRPPQRGVQ